ncbi:MAG: hypothetical protein E4H36_10420 [Spirochaetales bacterium]|nr:MAG: hypothetical protein E4H36_10420 [Spirochaetales bacterium]
MQKLAGTGSFSREELLSVYRILCKNTHPDLTGKDGADFIKVQEAFSRFRNNAGKGSLRPTAAFDPFKVIRETGWKGGFQAKNSLYLGLYRYFLSGLHSYRIRSNQVLQERNLQIIRTILYWAEKYDKEFVRIFTNFNRSVFNHLRISEHYREELKARKILLDGFYWFLHYQDTGRESSRRICLEKLNASAFMLRLFSPLTGSVKSPCLAWMELCLWLQQELDKEPVGFHILF